jgi:hypothetical protein
MAARPLKSSCQADDPDFCICAQRPQFAAKWRAIGGPPVCGRRNAEAATRGFPGQTVPPRRCIRVNSVIESRVSSVYSQGARMPTAQQSVST